MDASVPLPADDVDYRGITALPVGLIYYGSNENASQNDQTLRYEQLKSAGMGAVFPLIATVQNSQYGQRIILLPVSLFFDNISDKKIEGGNYEKDHEQIQGPNHRSMKHILVQRADGHGSRDIIIPHLPDTLKIAHSVYKLKSVVVSVEGFFGKLQLRSGHTDQ